MAEMRKLKVIVFEDYVDAIVRSLGEAGITQLIDMREKVDEWKGVLLPYTVSAETLTKCSDITTKIGESLKTLGLKPEDLPLTEAPSTTGSTKELLAQVEQKLADLPVDTLRKCSEISARISQLIDPLQLKPDEVAVEELPPEKPVEEALAQLEQKIREIPIETAVRLSEVTARIDQLVDALHVKPEEVTIEKVVLDKPIGEALTEIEQNLTQIEKQVATVGLTDRALLVDKIGDLSLDEKSELGKMLSELRHFVLETRRMFGARLLGLRNFVADRRIALGKELLTLGRVVETVRQATEAETKVGEVREDLLTLQKVVEREKQVTQAEEKLARTSKTVYFEAWVPEAYTNEATERVKKASNGNCLVSDEPPTHEEKAPVILKPVPQYLSAFEKLVYAFGYPSAGDINPVPILALTFPILFGLMFADVGQGALFVLIGVVLTFLKRRIRTEKMGDVVRYLLVSSEMFMFLGVSAIFFGFIFGEFFGPSGILHPISLGRVGPFYIGGFEPTQEPMKMLKLAVFVGTIHIGLGLVLRFLNETRRKHYKLVPVPLCWMWLLFGGLFMWAYWGGISNISRWFAEGVFMLAGLVVLPLVLIIGVTSLAEGFMEGLGFGVEVFAETLSHTMSYSRLMALGLVHSAMNYLFLVLGGVEHGHFPLESIPMIAVGTILVMIIEGLVVFVHTLRLHWVEWFSKFHTGEGIAFKPFKFT